MTATITMPRASPTRPPGVLYQDARRPPVMTGRGAAEGRLRAWPPRRWDLRFPLIAMTSDYSEARSVFARRLLTNESRAITSSYSPYIGIASPSIV